MARRTRSRLFQNPTNFIRWQENIVLFSQMAITLVGQVRILIDQATGTGTLNDYPVAGDIFWPSQQLYDATNEVLVDYWPMLGRQWTPVQLTNTNFVVSSGTDIFTYDTTKIMIPGYFVLNHIFGSGSSQQWTNQRYWVTDRSKLEQWSNDWRLDIPAQPRWFLLWDAGHIRVYPSPDTTYTFNLYGVPWPTEMISGTEDITCDPILKLSIAYKAAANILEATRPDVADAYMRESEELLNRYKIRLRNQQTNNVRRIKPGSDNRTSDITMAANKGVIRIGRKLS